MDIAHWYLDGNADAVEFCPHENFQNVLAAATYTLQEEGNDEPASRSGSISLFDVDAEIDRFDLFDKVNTAGIFDIKWNPVGGGGGGGLSPLLAQADADGFLRIHRLECGSDGNQGMHLREINNAKISSSMCLCLDWNPSATSISIGLSDGSIATTSLSESQFNKQHTWQPHDFEVWTTSFDLHQPQLLYSGSDDCKFFGWDLRTTPSNPAFQNTKAHNMGICSIAKSPYNDNILLTGSYDEYLRVWDIRSISRPVSETSICLGGGVWRIKHHPSVPGLVLAACMHAGFAIVKIDGDKAEIIETYSKHGSLAYGADWQRGSSIQEGGTRKTLVATCSFYDKHVRVWVPDSDIFG